MGGTPYGCPRSGLTNLSRSENEPRPRRPPGVPRATCVAFSLGGLPALPITGRSGADVSIQGVRVALGATVFRSGPSIHSASAEAKVSPCRGRGGDSTAAPGNPRGPPATPPERRGAGGTWRPRPGFEPFPSPASFRSLSPPRLPGRRAAERHPDTYRGAAAPLLATRKERPGLGRGAA